MPKSSAKVAWLILVGTFALVAIFFAWSRQPSASAPGLPPVTVGISPAPPSESTLPDVPSDLRAALASAFKQPDPRQRAREFGVMLEQWVSRDPEDALAYVLLLPRGPEFSQGLLMALDALSRRDPVRALVLAREHISTREERAFYSSVFDRLVRQNVTAAISHLALVPAGESRTNAVRALADAWTRTAPADALAWALGLPDAADDRAIALESVLLDLGAREPSRAVELAGTSLPGTSRQRVVQGAIRALLQTDPVQAALLVAQLPPGETHTHAAVDVARACAERDVPAALAWIGTLSDDRVRRLALNSVLTRWAARDAAAAGRYVAALPDGLRLDYAVQHLAPILATTDARAAIAWAENLASPSARSTALVMIASTWAQHEPTGAVQWASQLLEENTRGKAIAAAYSYWILQDSAAARTWLETAPLSVDFKDRLSRGLR